MMMNYWANFAKTGKLYFKNLYKCKPILKYKHLFNQDTQSMTSERGLTSQTLMQNPWTEQNTN